MRRGRRFPSSPAARPGAGGIAPGGGSMALFADIGSHQPGTERLMRIVMAIASGDNDHGQ
jgi:hypothetical protein